MHLTFISTLIPRWPVVAPTEAPTMADGGFVVNEVGQSCEKDFVNVTFYWKVNVEKNIEMEQ